MPGTPTPNLGLITVTDDDNANTIVRVAHNANVAVLDNAVMLTAAQSLSSKTLVAPTVSGTLTLSTAVSKVRPGATSLSLRNNGDSADNVLVTDAGVVTLRSNLVAGVGTFTAGSIYTTAAAGLVFGGKTGSATDLVLTNNAGATVLDVPTTTTNARFAGSLVLTTAASRIVPGATSLALRNNADSADNLLITNAGAATVRTALTVGTDVTMAGLFVNSKVDAASTTATSVQRTSYTFSAAAISGTMYGHDVTLTYSGGTSAADLRSGAFVVITSGAGNTAQAFGVYGRTSNTGTGTIAFAVGHYGVIQNTGGGSITTASAFYAYTPNITSGTVPTAIGYNAENQGQTGVTNAYGVRIAAQSGASTLNFSLMCEGTARFDGVVTLLGSSGLAAGGALAIRFTSASTSPQVYVGSGAPAIGASKGSLYLRSDGSATNNRAYINQDGSTLWTALTTAA